MAAYRWFAGIMTLGVADLFVKQQIEEQLLKREEKPVLGGRILLRRVHNRGFALNALDARPKLVKYGSLLAGLICTGFGMPIFLGKGCLVRKSGMALVLAGAFSNIYDRIVRGFVIDYFGIQTKWKKFSDITFNLGDIFVFAGVAMLFYGKKE